METREKIARTIAGLYNRAKAQGMGFLHFTPDPMSKEKAYEYADLTLSEGALRFDYLQGRVMKVEIKADGSVPRVDLYERDNGPGSAARAIEAGMKDPRYS